MELTATPFQKPAAAPTPGLRLTPQLAQALHILELPALELKNYLEKELVLNPVLEEDWPLERGSDDAAAEKREYFERNIPQKPISLEEHVLRQTALLGFSKLKSRIAAEIAGNLSDDGYLCSSLPQIAENTGAPLEEVQAVLSAIQGLDPPGIAARDLRESLLIQLESGLGTGDVSTKALAKTIVRDHFEDLKKRKFQKITADLKIAEAKIRAALECIRSLRPRPALGFQTENPRYVVPDVILKPVGRGFKINCRGDEMRLRIDPAYRKLLKDKNTPPAVKKYLKEKLSHGLSLVRAVDQRERTIQKIVRWMAGQQLDFFSHGPGHLKPFTLEQAAGFLGFHKSTLSRALAGKYIETPHGTFELKKLFSPALGSGEQVFSAFDIQNQIRHLIDQEDKTRPLSDDKMAALLKSKGIAVARRTIAKYRQLLRILPTSLRKVV